jgi:hypothetical protein
MSFPEDTFGIRCQGCAFGHSVLSIRPSFLPPSCLRPSPPLLPLPLPSSQYFFGALASAATPSSPSSTPEELLVALLRLGQGEAPASRQALHNVAKVGRGRGAGGGRVVVDDKLWLSPLAPLILTLTPSDPPFQSTCSPSVLPCCVWPGPIRPLRSRRQ